MQTEIGLCSCVCITELYMTAASENITYCVFRCTRIYNINTFKYREVQRLPSSAVFEAGSGDRAQQDGTGWPRNSADEKNNTNKRTKKNRIHRRGLHDSIFLFTFVDNGGEMEAVVSTRSGILYSRREKT